MAEAMPDFAQKVDLHAPGLKPFLHLLAFQGPEGPCSYLFDVSTRLFVQSRRALPKESILYGIGEAMPFREN